AGGRSTGHSLAPSTQIQFMNNQSKKCLSEQHCAIVAGFFYAAPKRQPPPDFATNSDCGPHPSSSTDDCHLQSKVAASLTRFSSLFHYTTHQQRHARHFFMQKHEILRINIQKSSGKYQP
ncbi:hypothetical protein, partial [Aeromonas caviae]